MRRYEQTENMNQYKQYGRMSSSQNQGDFQKFLRARKEVPVNTLLILINIVVFLGVELTGSSLDTRHMLRWGAAGTMDVLQGGEYYRLVTAMFLHFGIRHLGNNMLVLFFLGDCLERNVGKIKYFIIYMLGGIGASCLSLWYEVHQGAYVVSAGASGAVFAVIGALVYVVLLNRGHVENFTVRQLAVLAGLSLYHGLTSAGVDNTAHFGGLFCGFILGMLLYHKHHKMRMY